jgi:uncharacterized protein (DUF433 family)
VPSLIGKGSYGVPEAARLARVPVRTASRWICGSGENRRGRLINPDLPVVDNRHALSFLDLVDLLVVGRFREQSVSFQIIRRVYSHLRNRLETAHPFGHQRLLTDGSTVFMETLDEVGEPNLQEVLTGQRTMPVILRPYLSQIDYSATTSTAARWRIAPGVVVDPARALGKPTVEAANTTTFVLAESYWANSQDAELVADLFDVSPDAVRRAVDFEEQIARPLAA